MFRRFRLKRQIALTLIVTMVMQFIYAGVAYALSEGPTQPEAMQFEPVTTTDLVNLQTGDFSYTLPLMEIPGPEGGYPLSMSYHAGIGTNQEATSTGLGWNINPGSINRIVNGYPDDFDGANVETHFESSEVSGSGINLSLGYGPLGLNMNFDNNKGFGIVGLTLSLQSYGIGVSSSISAYGVGFNTSIGLMSVEKAVIGINAGTQGISAGIYSGALGFSLNNHSDISLNTGPLHFSLYKNGEIGTGIGGVNISGGGMSSMTNAGEGITKYYQSPTVNPLLPLSILGVNCGISRYEWSWKLNQNSTEKSYGYLNQEEYYTSPEANKKYERQQQGHFLYSSQDIYLTKSQTINGVFQPFMKNAYLIKDTDNETGLLTNNNYDYCTYISFGPYTTNNKAIFRFLGDPGANYSTVDGGSELPGIDDWGLDYQNIFTGQFNEKYSSRRIDTICDGNKIKGFRVVDTDGKIYEFFQPVFNYLFYSWSQTAPVNPGGVTYTSYTSFNEPYASDWLLTGIKGPDYIDNDWSEDMSEADYGFWIKFNYNVSPIQQVWRSPYSGDAPGPSSFYVSSNAFGIRDQVYLSSIESATHNAQLFYSLSGNRGILPPNVANSTILSVEPLNLRTKHYFKGNWCGILDQTANYPNVLAMTAIGHYRTILEDCNNYQIDILRGNITSYTYDQSTNITTVIENKTPLYKPATSCSFDKYSQSTTFYLGNLYSAGVTPNALKLDSISLYKKNNLYNNEFIKSINFTYQTHLCEGTPNSSLTSQHKLTLDKVEFHDKSYQPFMPPYQFEYANNDEAGIGLNPDYNLEDWDRWGSFRDSDGGADRGHTKHLTPQDKIRADKSAAWSLTKIIFPSGGETIIEYESDDYYHVTDRIDQLYATEHLVTAAPRISRNYVIMPGGIPDDLRIDGEIFILRKKTTWDFIGGNPYHTAISFKRKILHIYPNENKIEFDSDVPFLADVPLQASYTFAVLITPKIIYGGGIRVKSICCSDGLNIYKTRFGYVDEFGYSTGVASSLPPQYQNFGFDTWDEIYRRLYLDHELSLGRPVPAVNYGRVEVFNVNPQDDKPLNGKTVYDFYTAYDYPYFSDKNNSTHVFTTIDKSSIYGSPKRITYYEQYNDGGIKFRKSKIDEFTYTFGDELNQNNKLAKCINQQISELTTDQHLGVTQEKYSFRNEASNVSCEFYQYYNEKRILNSYLTDTIAKEYFYNSETGSQPNDSLTITSKFFTFDALTGCAIATATQDSRNDYTNITRKIPAYWKYDDMRSYENQISNIFQTTQYYSNVSIGYNWKDYDFGQHNADIVSSEITTWVNASVNSIGWTWGWKINDTYRYDNYFPYQEFPSNMLDNLDEGYPDVTSSFPWLKTSNITEYDRFSHPVEESMIDGSYITAQYNYDESLPEAIIKGARKNVNQIGREASYIGFERANNQPGFFFGEEDSWTLDPVNYNSSDKHTGKYSYKVIGGSLVDGPKREFLPPTLDSQKRKFKFSFWVKTEAGFTNGSLIVHTKQNNNNNTVYPSGISEANIIKQITDTQGKWVYLEGIIDLAKIRELGAIPDATSLRIRCLPQNNNSKYMLIDDIRFRPVDATMATYTYDPISWNVTSITDNNDITTYYEYDSAGRLVCVRDQDYKVIKTYSYQYGKSF